MSQRFQLRVLFGKIGIVKSQRDSVLLPIEGFPNELAQWMGGYRQRVLHQHWFDTRSTGGMDGSDDAT
jgi:hypothetical protein